MRVATTTPSGPVALLDPPASNPENSHPGWTKPRGPVSVMPRGSHEDRSPTTALRHLRPLRALIPMALLAALLGGCGPSEFTIANDTDGTLTVVDPNPSPEVTWAVVGPHRDVGMPGVTVSDGECYGPYGWEARDPAGTVVATIPKLCPGDTWRIP